MQDRCASPASVEICLGELKIPVVQDLPSDKKAHVPFSVVSDGSNHGTTKLLALIKHIKDQLKEQLNCLFCLIIHSFGLVT